MAEYICREALIKELEANFNTDWADYASKNNFDKDYIDGVRDEYDDTLRIICQQKTADVQPVKRCKMIPLEPDCRSCTDVFICTNCHQHIHLGFIRKEYSGNFCIECGAEVEDGDAE